MLAGFPYHFSSCILLYSLKNEVSSFYLFIKKEKKICWQYNVLYVSTSIQYMKNFLKWYAYNLHISVQHLSLDFFSPDFFNYKFSLIVIIILNFDISVVVVVRVLLFLVLMPIDIALGSATPTRKWFCLLLIIMQSEYYSCYYYFSPSSSFCHLMPPFSRFGHRDSY